MNRYDKELQDKLKNYAQKPSSAVWERVHARLPNYPQDIWLKTAAVATVFLVLSLFAGIAFLKPSGQPITAEATILPLLKSGENLSNGLMVSSAGVAQNKHDTNSATESSQMATPPMQGAILTDRSSDELRSEHVEESLAGSQSVTNASGIEKSADKEPSATALEMNALKSLSSVMQDVEFPAREHAEPILLNSRDFRGFSLGVLTSFHHTWMINRDVERRLIHAPKITPAFTTGPAFGLAFGYNFSSKFGVELDYIFHSSEGQNYSVPTEMGNEVKRAGVSFTRIPILFKYKMSRISPIDRKSPVVINYMLGAQYGFRNFTNIDDQVRFVREDDLNKADFGVVAGIEWDFHFDDDLSFSLGTRASLNSATPTFPQMGVHDFALPHTVLIGLTAKLNYAFK